MAFLPQQSGTAVVDFGNLDDMAKATIIAPWVQPDSKIDVLPAASQLPDHDVEDFLIEGIRLMATNIVPGESFDILAHAPDSTSGKYNVNYSGR